MDKHRLSLIVIAVLAIAILFGGLVIGVQPQVERMNRADAQAETLAATNDIQEARNRALASDNANLDAYKSDLASREAMIPSARSQQELINQIDAASTSAGVSVRSLTFDAAAPYSPPAGVKITGPSSSTLVAVPLTLAADGERAKLESFVKRLQASGRIVTLGASQYTGGDVDALTLTGLTWVLLPS